MIFPEHLWTSWSRIEVTTEWTGWSKPGTLHTMPAGKLERMPVARRRLLVRTAAREFAAAGYEKASLNRIIQSCGLSTSSFYHVIASKRDLFDLVVRDLTDIVRETVRIPEPEALAGPGFWPKVEAFLDLLTEEALANTAFNDLGRMFYLSETPADAQQAVTEAMASIEAWLHDVLLAGRGSGAVRDDLPITLQVRLVFAVLRALDEWSLANIDELEAPEIAALERSQLATIRRILEPT
jgi:AcrR family transcriptional regulator